MLSNAILMEAAREKVRLRPHPPITQSLAFDWSDALVYPSKCSHRTMKLVSTTKDRRCAKHMPTTSPHFSNGPSPGNDSRSVNNQLEGFREISTRSV
ncbi:hypothetical protein HBI67_134650 [Parastagonospora nodorum]|nr:hypothetical protein HBI72_149580 [Parastagonospora nodorum]KAH5702340.1 hypothetical protein HBI44_027830 [Parastagonospora nodorum]KAH6064386.1 hypothetical protein HBI67_134650 [Parastagonospora nodorum]